MIFRVGICSIYLWPVLGWQDIKQRYRRSVIGPFWLTISYGATDYGYGPRSMAGCCSRIFPPTYRTSRWVLSHGSSSPV
jgi:hypothetical protein